MIIYPQKNAAHRNKFSVKPEIQSNKDYVVSETALSMISSYVS